jgi:exonuclease III
VNPAALLWGSLGITFAAQNCNSLNVVSSIKNQDLKLSAIIGYKQDIIFLSDTRINRRDGTICDRLKLWYNVYHNSTKNCRGVAVLIGKQVEHEIIDTGFGPSGKCITYQVKDKRSRNGCGCRIWP